MGTHRTPLCVVMQGLLLIVGELRVRDVGGVAPVIDTIEPRQQSSSLGIVPESSPLVFLSLPHRDATGAGLLVCPVSR